MNGECQRANVIGKHEKILETARFLQISASAEDETTCLTAVKTYGPKSLQVSGEKGRISLSIVELYFITSATFGEYTVFIRVFCFLAE